MLGFACIAGNQRSSVDGNARAFSSQSASSELDDGRLDDLRELGEGFVQVGVAG